MSQVPDFAARNVERMFFKAKIIEAMREFSGESENDFTYDEMILILHEIIAEVTEQK